MAGEKAVQNNLLEILSGAQGARENSAFSADEGVALSQDDAVDSATFEAREALDVREGLAAFNLDKKATFSAGGGPVVAGDHSAIKIMASAARVAVAGISLAVFGLLATAGFIVWDIVTPNPWDMTIEIPVSCQSNGSLGSSFLSLIAGCK